MPEEGVKALAAIHLLESNSFSLLSAENKTMRLGKVAEAVFQSAAKQLAKNLNNGARPVL